MAGGWCLLNQNLLWFYAANHMQPLLAFTINTNQCLPQASQKVRRLHCCLTGAPRSINLLMRHHSFFQAQKCKMTFCESCAVHSFAVLPLPWQIIFRLRRGTCPPAKAEAENTLGRREHWGGGGNSLVKEDLVVKLLFFYGQEQLTNPSCLCFLCGITKLESCFSMNMRLLKNRNWSAVNSAGPFEATKRRLFCWEMPGLGTRVSFVRASLCSSWRALSTTPRFACAVCSGQRRVSVCLGVVAKRILSPSTHLAQWGQWSSMDTHGR